MKKKQQESNSSEQQEINEIPVLITGLIFSGFLLFMFWPQLQFGIELDAIRGYIVVFLAFIISFIGGCSLAIKFMTANNHSDDNSQ